jgi:hypothetical protein
LFGEFLDIWRENLHFEEFEGEIILSFCASIKSAIASVAAAFHDNYLHRTICKSTNLP